MFKRATATNANTKKANPASQPQSSNYDKYPELKALDARLKSISDLILQPSPYILTVPSDRPYNRDPRLANEWRSGTPFDEDEEQLQYLSFLANWGNSLVRPVGGWDNARGEMMDRSNSQQSNKSGSSATGSTRKIKYSLADYKKKAATQSGTIGSKDNEGATRLNGTASENRKHPPPHNEKNSLKRSHEDGEITENLSEVRSPKRRRSSPLPSASPPPKKRPSSPPLLELPPDISPTLHPVIERELARLTRLENLDEPSEEKRKVESAKKEAAPLNKTKVHDKDANRKNERPTNHEAPAKAKQKEDRSNTVNGVASKPSRPQDKDGSSSHSKPSKIVRLRIPKSIRTNVIRLLKIPPRRQKQSELGSKGVARRIERSPHRDRSRERDKRPRSDDDDEPLSAAKRAKKPAGLDLSKPTTPVPPSFRSPAISHHGSGQKPSVTSEPAGRSLAAHRDELSASTPLAAIRNGTPNAPDSVDRREGRPTSSHAAARPQRSQQYHELRQIERELINIGRVSKHSSDRELKNKSTDNETPTPSEAKRGLAFGIECILAFMLSYSARDEITRAAPPEGPVNETWTTLFQYIRQVKRVAAEHEQSHMQGLCMQLEAICHFTAWTHLVEHATSSEDPPRLASIMKHYTAAQSLLAEGAAILPLDALQHSFPKTWSAKSAVPLAQRAAEAASNGTSAATIEVRSDGEFSLPINSISTPVEAVRAGRALLIEWAGRQRIDWNVSLGVKKKIDEKEK